MEKNGLGKNKIPIYEPDLSGNELKYVTDCITSGWVSSAGKYVKKFEGEFAKYIGTKYSTSTSNGTTALHLALESFGITNGDEVIIPDFTFAATASSVMHAGAKPIVADINKSTLNISVDSIREKITPKTKAIIPVHIYGAPAPMKEIMELAKEKNLIVIEDAAEAHGAMIGSKKVGSFGDAAIFSFYGNKILTSGEGGIIVSDNEKIIKKANILKNHGMSSTKKYWHEVVGYNYRLTNVQAAIGLEQLERIEEIIEKKICVAKNYEKLLSGTNYLQVPIQEKNTRNVYWMYWIISHSKENSIKKISTNLANEGIETRPMFYPLSTMLPFKQQTTKNSIAISQNGLCLPSSSTLTQKIQEKISSIIIS